MLATGRPGGASRPAPEGKGGGDILPGGGQPHRTRCRSSNFLSTNVSKKLLHHPPAHPGPDPSLPEGLSAAGISGRDGTRGGEIIPSPGVPKHGGKSRFYPLFPGHSAGFSVPQRRFLPRFRLRPVTPHSAFWGTRVWLCKGGSPPGGATRPPRPEKILSEQIAQQGLGGFCGAGEVFTHGGRFCSL